MHSTYLVLAHRKHNVSPVNFQKNGDFSARMRTDECAPFQLRALSGPKAYLLKSGKNLILMCAETVYGRTSTGPAPKKEKKKKENVNR